MTYKEIFKKAVPQEKKDDDKFAFVSTYISRPISILLTKPLLETDVRATTITKISVASIIVGFIILFIANSIYIQLLGWSFFFLWAILDHVDGNLARFKNDCTLLGDLWDTMGGYLAMVLMYFVAGVLAFKEMPYFVLFDSYYYLILGGATSLFSIFPRLMMHKRKSSEKNAVIIKELTEKKSFNLPKIVVLNLLAPTDGLLLLFLVSILLHCFTLFIIFYCIITFMVMVKALHGILSE